VDGEFGRKEMSVRILVLGGHGFVGKNFVAVLKDSEHTVIPLSRRDGLDLRDYVLTKRHFARIQPDAIVNCAAHVGSLHYVTTYAADVLHDNVQMALSLYRATQEVCPSVRIINPLSNCSYPGDADVHYEPDWWKGGVHQSVYAYGNSKRFIYVMADCYKQQYGIRSVNFLVPNSFGPGDYTDPNKTHALNGMIIRLLKVHREGQPEFEIWGTGKPVREWGYIGDVVEVMKHGLTIQEDLTYPVNIAQNHGYSIGESARMIAKAIGFQGKLTFNTQYQDGAPRKVLDDERFREIFPDYQFIDHEEGIQRTVAYYESVL